MRSIRICNSRGAQTSQKSRKLQFFENCHSTSLMWPTLPPPTLFPMNFLEWPVVPRTCIWYRTRSTNNLSQNELMKPESCPNNRPKFTNNFGPMLSHLARCFPKSRVWYRITLRDKLYESLEEFEFVLDSARSAAKTPNFVPKYATSSLETAIFAHVLDLGAAHTFSNGFSGTPRVSPNLHMVQSPHHKQPQPKRIDETRVMPK